MAERNEKKKMAVVLLVLLLTGLGIYGLVLFLESLQVTAMDSPKKKEIYESYYVLIEDGHDSTLWDSIYEGARKEGEENCNAYVEYLGKNLTADYTVQDKLRIAIDSGVDGIILNGGSSEETIRKLLVTEEEQPDILICLSETDTRRAYEAVVDYIKVGEVRILGYYKSEGILDAVQKKIISSTVVVDGEQLGRFCVQALTEYRETGYVNGYFPVDTYVIDENNVGQYRLP